MAAQLRALGDYADMNGYMVVDEAAFKEILICRFSRSTRKREHAATIKSMLRCKDIRVQAQDNASGRPKRPSSRVCTNST